MPWCRQLLFVVRRKRCAAKTGHGLIEIEVDGITIRGRSWCRPNEDCVDRPGPEGKPVIGPSGAVRVMVATTPVDFRNGMGGLPPGAQG